MNDAGVLSRREVRLLPDTAREEIAPAFPGQVRQPLADRGSSLLGDFELDRATGLLRDDDLSMPDPDGTGSEKSASPPRMSRGRLVSARGSFRAIFAWRTGSWAPEPAICRSPTETTKFDPQEPIRGFARGWSCPTGTGHSHPTVITRIVNRNRPLFASTAPDDCKRLQLAL